MLFFIDSGVYKYDPGRINMRIQIVVFDLCFHHDQI